MNESLNLLLVEDNPGDARLIREMVADVPDAQCGFAVAGSMREAVAALAANPVDAVLLDLSLPDSKGLQTLQRVRVSTMDIPVVVLTGLGDDSTALHAVQEGAQDYLVKGDFDGRSLLRSVRYAIERARAERVDRERRGLETALGAMDHLLAVIGHELRTPLTSLRLLSEYMLSDQNTAMTQWETHLTSINGEVLRMTDMVNNLLEAARLDSGVSQWNWGHVDLCAVCVNVLGLLRPLIDGTRQTLSADGVPPGTTMRGDPDAVRRLLVNLANNAIKHTRSGRIEIAAERNEAAGENLLRITVRDNGAGMSEDILARLGTAFAINSGVAGSSQSGGTGLGLAICKGIAAAHGGTVSVSSERGRGTLFCVTLRTDLEAPAQVPADLKILREAAA
ncbi:MAG: hybrid sensor histidine kinase/response regulator [Phycisphaeraceae bacterium]|nr:hybrid sensor histidine kinase/response regulator [Phycisphaeraceae bacterium]